MRTEPKNVKWQLSSLFKWLNNALKPVNVEHLAEHLMNLLTFSHKHYISPNHVHSKLLFKLSFISQQHMFISVKQDDWTFRRWNIISKLALLYFCFIQNTLPFTLSVEMIKDCKFDCITVSVWIHEWIYFEFDIVIHISISGWVYR